MKEMDILEFRRRLKLRLGRPEVRFTFFIGAGCSVSSGIPSADSLVMEWLPRLKEIKTGNNDDVEEWAKGKFGDEAIERPATIYARVIEELFRQTDDRQAEIERICSNVDPALGYAALAKLMTHPKYGHRCNTVLTTNFDDLVADGLYLYERVKPIVISHESLIGFARTVRSVPLVVKLHGDAKFAPMNTEEETAELDKAVKEVMGVLLRDSALVFIGYGGNDGSITKVLQDLSSSSLHSGIYWVKSSIPDTELGEWLNKRDTTFVKHHDFDELMVHISEEFELDYPIKELFRDRFDELENKNTAILKELKAKIAEKSGTEAEVLEGAVERMSKQFSKWWAFELEAEKYKKTDPDKADEIYRRGLEQFRDSHQLMNNYANFLLLTDKPGVHDAAEKYYKRAIKVEPNSPVILSNYADFLSKIREDYDAADDYHKRAIEAGPDDAVALGTYADFLWKVRDDYDGAEGYFKRAIDADPNNARNLGNYAGFLLGQGRIEEGFEVLAKSQKSEPADDQRLETLFYYYAHFPKEPTRANSLKQIKELIISGVRSPHFDLSKNVARAIEAGHPEPELLACLAKVIAKDADASELDKFEAWKKA